MIVSVVLSCLWLSCLIRLCLDFLMSFIILLDCVVVWWVSIVLSIVVGIVGNMLMCSICGVGVVWRLWNVCLYLVVMCCVCGRK